jgi:uncharacterized membrane protein
VIAELYSPYHSVCCGANGFGFEKMQEQRLIEIASSSITVLLNTKIIWLITIIKLPEFGSWPVIKALTLLPLVLMIGLFAFTFIFMLNHKINYRAGSL